MTLRNRSVRLRPLNFARTIWMIGALAALAGIAEAQPRSHGPTKGYLLITGGATQPPDYQRFIEMAQAYAAESEDAHPLDEDYLRAMRYGMPPNGGFGMGLDRLTMLFTDKSTIREVILFPHLREKGSDEKD